MRAQSTLVLEVPAHSLDELNLLLDRQARDGELHDVAVCHLVFGDEGVEIHVGKEAHDELAVHAVSHASVSGNGVAKVLDLEGALEARGEEAAKGSDQGRKGRDDDGVELDGLGGDAQRVLVAVGEEEELGHLVGAREEDGVGVALEAGEDVGAEVVDGADEVLAAHQQVGEEDGKDDCHDPGADKTLDRLLGAQLDELGAAKGDSTNVGKDVIGDDQRSGQEEPKHALEHIVHDEVRLHHNQVESHVRPSKVGELELEVPGTEVGDEEDEANDIEDKADEAVVGCQGQKHPVDEHNVLEVVDDALAVEKVHGARQPVPVEALGSLDVPGAGRHGRNGDDLLERDDLDGGHDGDDVDVTHEEGGEEAGDHDQGPEGTGYEVGLLLLVVGRGRSLWLLVNVSQLGRRSRAGGRRRAILADLADTGPAAMAVGLMGELDPSARFGHDVGLVG